MRTHLGSHQNVVNAWADNSQEHGRGFNVWFEGRVIYSYGRHFPLAMRLDNGCFLVNTDDSSVSTAKHRSIVWRSIGPRPSLSVTCEEMKRLVDLLPRHDGSFRECLIVIAESRRLAAHGRAIMAFDLARGCRKAWTLQFALDHANDAVKVANCWTYMLGENWPRLKPVETPPDLLEKLDRFKAAV